MSSSRLIALFALGFISFIAGRMANENVVHAQTSKQDPMQVPRVPPVVNDDKDTKEALNEIREFAKAAKPLVEDLHKMLRKNDSDISKTIQSLAAATDAINSILNDENRKTIAAILKNVQVSSDQLGKTISSFAFALDTADRMMKNFNERVNTAEKLMTSATATMKNIEAATKPIGENGGAALKNLADASEQMARTLTEMRSTLATVNRTDGSFHRLMTDQSIFNNLNASTASLTRVLLQAEQIAHDLQVFSDKIARRPELIGIGGAIRPSHGTKDAPGIGPCLPPSVLEVPNYKLIPPTRGDISRE